MFEAKIYMNGQIVFDDGASRIRRIRRKKREAMSRTKTKNLAIAS